MKFLNKYTLIAMILAISSALLAIKLLSSVNELKSENKRLCELIATSPQRISEHYIDSIEVPFKRKKDTVIAKIKIVKRRQHSSPGESSIPVAYMDSIARALKIGQNAITKLTRVNAEMKNKLDAKDLKIKNLKENIWEWEDSNSNVKANLNDSTATVRYDAKITLIDYSKKASLFSDREYYAAVLTDDPNLKINGLQLYEQKLNVKCHKFNFSGYAGYGAQLNNNNINLGPQIGVGLTLDLF